MALKQELIVKPLAVKAGLSRFNPARIFAE